ncbi:SDR family NAD(P)-dependent oxidoreductase [Nocardioides sp. SOB77]|uniref:SDR family NAD(P)-dependent oxidoreductase n=1 Tax=Nocardioides oceani TaxID=3058369 RepID=A0ABT8FAI4_9ACTN|nr:SDR family NAD(P)-dependent oxidoreductase [Nocardioides oceani]MDN4171465.1 SDR family NAD(P)-dependent oxidoreductase [Nocardioides oceani]
MSKPRPGDVVVITGASSGIGRATALAAAAEGTHLVLAARGVGSLDLVAAECDDAGAASTMVVPTDVGDDAAVRALVDTVLDRHGHIDAFINSAGVVAYGRTEEVPQEVFDGVLRTNLLGTANVARHVVPVLRGQDSGTLTLVGSVIGHIAVPGMTAYAVSKWGVRALARQLKLENADKRGVTISYVAPGGVDTPIYQQAANYDGFEGRPPPPVASPERVAKQILSRLDRQHAWSQLLVSNEVIRFGFSAVPFVYDAIIGPFFRHGAIDRLRPTEATTGNVLAPRQSGNKLHGDQGNALVGIARNVLSSLRG